MKEVESHKPNIGVFTNPAHELWVASAEPSAEQAQSGATLQDGQVTVAIKSTGICGSVFLSNSQRRLMNLTDLFSHLAPISTFGGMDVSAP